MNKVIIFFRTIIHDVLMVIAPKWLKRKIMSCQEITELLASDEQLKFSKKTMLKMHLLICQCCTNYNKQMDFISRNIKEMDSLKLDSKQLEQIENAKEKMMARINK